MSNNKPKPLSEIDAAILWAAIKETTSQRAYKLTLNLVRAATVFDSKVGG